MCKSQYDLSQCAWRLKGTAPYVPLRENSMDCLLYTSDAADE